MTISTKIKELYAKGRAYLSGVVIKVGILSRRNLRERRNVLTWLTPQRAVTLYDKYRQGQFADVMLTWDAMEEVDDMLATVIDKRYAAIKALDSSVVIDSEAVGDDEALNALAEAQKQYVAAKMAKVTDMKKAVEFLASASFRGYAHLEIIETSEGITLAPIDQWLVVRPQRGGPWCYNAHADSYCFKAEVMDTSVMIVREVARAIDIPAMFAVVGKAHAIDGWDGFIDVFGNPAIFFEQPPGTPDPRAAEYDAMVQRVVGDGRGTYPNGGKFVTLETTARDGGTFRDRADWSNKQIVRRGTGSELTVTAESGTGSLAGNAHQQTFEGIAAAEGAAISEIITNQLVHRWLDVKFPRLPKLVFWKLAYEEKEDTSGKVTDIATLAGAGYRADDAEVSEVAGITVKSVPQQNGPTYYQPGSQLYQNRATAPAAAEEQPLTSAELAALEALASLTPDPSQIARQAKLLKTAIKGRLSGGAVNEPSDAMPPIANPLHGSNSAADDSDEDDLLENAGPYKCWRPHCRGHRDPQSTGGQGRGTRGSRGDRRGDTSTPYKAGDNATAREKKDALQRSIAKVTRKGGTVKGAATIGKSKIDVTPGNPKTYGTSHIKAKHGKEKDTTPDNIAKTVAHGKAQKDPSQKQRAIKRRKNLSVTLSKSKPGEKGKNMKIHTAHERRKPKQ